MARMSRVVGLRQSTKIARDTTYNVQGKSEGLLLVVAMAADLFGDPVCDQSSVYPGCQLRRKGEKSIFGGC